MIAVIERLRRELEGLPPPLILYNKSHSGSRLLARILREQGVFLGARRNESEDALPLVPLVERIVTRHYPAFDRLWRMEGEEASEIVRVTAVAFHQHLEGFDPERYRGWGWKLCETMYALPFFSQLFPEVQVVHLIRDGRDVAWCDHVAPERPFWKKVYCDTDGLERYRGLWLTNRAYERRPHLYNALHWASSVRIGRAMGSMLGPRYHEVRYEELCTEFEESVMGLARGLGLEIDRELLARQATGVRRDSIGKHRTRSRRLQDEVLEIIEPALVAADYVPAHRAPSGGVWERLLAWLRGA